MVSRATFISVLRHTRVLIKMILLSLIFALSQASHVLFSRSLLIESESNELQLKSRTPQQSLYRAAQTGNLQKVEFVLEYADPTADNSYALRIAAANGHKQIVALLLKIFRIDITANEHEAFRKACRNGHLAVAQLLYDAQIVVDAKRNRQITVQHNYPIRKAAKYGHLGTVEWLLSVGANPDARSNAAICWASANGHLDIVKLLASCTSVNAAAYYNDAALGAASRGHSQVLAFLLSLSVVNVQDFGNEALYWAARKDFPHVMYVLLQNGRIDPAFWDNYTLEIAASYGSYKSIRVLLGDKRVLAKISDQVECDALIYAAYNGHTESLRVLLTLCPACNPNLGDAKPLRVAARQNNLECVNVLLQEERIQPSAKFNKVIRRAEQKGWQAMMDLLLADPRTAQYYTCASSSNVARRISRSMKSLSLRSKPRIDISDCVDEPILKKKYTGPPDLKLVPLHNSEHDVLSHSLCYASLSDSVSLDGQ